MNITKIIIPTLTLVIIASNLMGCAAVSKSELLKMLEQGDNIEIEVATPINQEQGTEQTLDWIQLDQLETVPELREQMDDIFKIVYQNDTKVGVFYVDLEGNQNGNNTLYNTFMNSKFRSYWNDEKVLSEVANAALDTYVDVEFMGNENSKAVYSAMNGYFNILADASPGYANPDSTLTRLEAMAGLFKAEHPVIDDLAEDKEFAKAVDLSSSNPNTIFASNLSEQSFLDIDSGSLDNMTANGTITRGEFVYMLVQQYFKSDYDTVDLKAECYEDTINGGDIASQQKFIENGTEKKYWQSYELTYAIQNPDKGCPERMYKALLVAFDKQIITDTNSAWDEALTKADFIELLTNAYSALPTITNTDRGTLKKVAVSTEKETTDKAPAGSTQSEPNASVTVDSAGSDVKLEEGDYIPVSPEEQKVQQETTQQESNATNDTSTSSSSSVMVDSSQYTGDTKTAIDNANELLEEGLFTEEEYLDLLGSILRSAEIDKQPAHIPAPDHVKAESTSNLPPNDTRTNITYDDVELPDHLKGSYIGN